MSGPVEKSLRRAAFEGPTEPSLVSTTVFEGMSDIARQVSAVAHDEVCVSRSHATPSLMSRPRTQSLNFRTAALKIAITRIADVYKVKSLSLFFFILTLISHPQPQHQGIFP